MLTVEQMTEEMRAVAERLHTSPSERMTEDEFKLFRTHPRGYAEPPWKKYFADIPISQWPE
jgi:hypothetical protein